MKKSYFYFNCGISGRLCASNQAVKQETVKPAETPAVSSPDGSTSAWRGRALFSPAVSPHDPNLMFVSTDMSGFFRSEDAGRNWTLLEDP